MFTGFVQKFVKTSILVEIRASSWKLPTNSKVKGHNKSNLTILQNLKNLNGFMNKQCILYDNNFLIPKSY